jgi:glycosyltransferase involved in cell wall biosynthesis
MRIAIVDNLPEGGAKSVVYEQVKGLARTNKVFYCTNNVVSGEIPESPEIETRRWTLEIPRRHGWLRPMTEAGLLIQLRTQYQNVASNIKAFRADVVLAHPDRYTQAPWILALTELPTVYFAHEWLRESYEPEWHPLNTINGLARGYEKYRRSMVKRMDRYLVHQADKVITTSQYNQDHFREAYGINAEVITLGNDSKYYNPGNKMDKKGYFLYFGETDALHGYDLLTAVRLIAPKELQIKTVSLADGRWRYNREEIRNLYRGAVATLCLDRNEPFGLVPLESMACGTPVIAVNEGGFRETVDDGVTGYLVPREPPVIYKIMKQLAVDREVRQVMGKAGRQRVLAHYQWKRHTKTLEDTLREVLR